MVWALTTGVSADTFSTKHLTNVDVRLSVDSLGGNMFWSAGVSLISDFPRKPHWPVKTHLFLNAGRLDVMDKSMLHETFRQQRLWTDCRCSSPIA